MEESENSTKSRFQFICGEDKGTTRKFLNNGGLRGKQKIPFHIAWLPRPQDRYNIVVDNSNLPFEHVSLEKSEDGSRFVHPMEKFLASGFIDGHAKESELVLCPIESTPFKLVETVKDLKELASKLQRVNEFAVDLEHNHYRSFQGLTCLIQISTRTEDFAVDTLKLHALVGPYLGEIFKAPSKRKVMHGADLDIVWLQRDFGIYICNLFDTGQASKVLQLERNSLEYLLHHFCGITANKEYQTSDWRLRPLPDEMLKYAREDTHYLLHIYDLMKSRLVSASTDGNGQALLVEVCEKSKAACMQLYVKFQLKDSSFLRIHGLRGANFNLQQLSVVSGLYKWRDSVARHKDESTGYILPNKALLEIAREMPCHPSKLRHLLKAKYPYVDCNLESIINIIKSSINNASAFENFAEKLQKEQEAGYKQQNEAVQITKVGKHQVYPSPEVKIDDRSTKLSISAEPAIVPPVKSHEKNTGDYGEVLDNEVFANEKVKSAEGEEAAQLKNDNSSIEKSQSEVDKSRDKKEGRFVKPSWWHWAFPTPASRRMDHR